MNWKRAAIIGASATAGVIATPFVLTYGLGALGFSAGGVVAGSTAAGIQAGIGNVAAGSAFAIAQSIAMGGTVPIGCTAIGGGIGGAVGTAFGVGAGADDEDTDLVAIATWARAELLAAVARMQSVAYTDLVAAWARAEVLAAAAVVRVKAKL